MIIRLTAEKDTDSLLSIFEEARRTIATLGIDQWQNGYPSHEVIESDIKDKLSYSVISDGTPIATFVMLKDGEKTYDKIYDGKWLSGDSHSYVAIHRVAILVSKRGSGISGEIIKYAEGYAKSLGRNSLRIDTHYGNMPMRKMLEKNGFSACGTIFLDSGEKRIAYEKLI